MAGLWEESDATYATVGGDHQIAATAPEATVSRGLITTITANGWAAGGTSSHT